MLDVTAALIVKNEKVLLARRKPGIPHEGWWEFPGGKPKEGETPEEAIVREIQEELGITCRVVRFVGEGRGQNGSTTIRLLGYELAWISGKLIPTDHDCIHWVSQEELLGYHLLAPDIPIAKAYIRSMNTIHGLP